MKKSKKYFYQKNIYMGMMLLFFKSLFFLQGCDNKVNQINKQKTIEYPDGKPGNYIVLSNSTINEFKLTEEQLKNFQYYLSDEVEIKLYYQNKIEENNKPSIKDTQFVPVKTLFIEKFTPCVIVKNIYSEEENKKKLDSLKKVILKNEEKYNEKYWGRKLTKVDYEILLKANTNLSEELTVPGINVENEYEIDVGNGITLIYDPRFKFFTRIERIDEKQSKLKSSYSWTRFDNNAGLLVDLSHPTIKYKNEDTLFLSGKRK
jgi:hypothetical protein